MKINMTTLLKDTYTKEKDFLTFEAEKTQLTKVRDSLIKKKTLLEKERETFDKEKEKLAKERETFDKEKEKLAKERESFTEAKKQLFKKLDNVANDSLCNYLKIEDETLKACDRLEDFEDEIQDKINDQEIPVILKIKNKIKNIRSNIKAVELFVDDIFKNDNIKKEIVDKFKKLHL